MSLAGSNIAPAHYSHATPIKQVTKKFSDWKQVDVGMES